MAAAPDPISADQACVLLAESVTCVRGKRKILNALSLPPLQGGKLVALVGPNGSGKSTLMRALAGLLPARIDTLTLNGIALHDKPAVVRANHLRYLPQSLPSHVHLTVTETLLVALNVRTANTPETQSAAMVRKVLDDLGIEHLANCYLDELSGGQQQLVGLAQTLITPPKVLLLDEPLASLDLNYQHHVLRLLLQLCEKRNMLILVVLHDLNLALSYASELLVLHYGKLAAAGSPASTLTSQLLEQVFSVKAQISAAGQHTPHLLIEAPLPLNPQ